MNWTVGQCSAGRGTPVCVASHSWRLRCVAQRSCRETLKLCWSTDKMHCSRAEAQPALLPFTARMNSCPFKTVLAVAVSGLVPGRNQRKPERPDGWGLTFVVSTHRYKETSADREVHATAGREAGATFDGWRCVGWLALRRMAGVASGGWRCVGWLALRREAGNSLRSFGEPALRFRLAAVHSKSPKSGALGSLYHAPLRSAEGGVPASRRETTNW
jgi:hypothetical protein